MIWTVLSIPLSEADLKKNWGCRRKRGWGDHVQLMETRIAQVIMTETNRMKRHTQSEGDLKIVEGIVEDRYHKSDELFKKTTCLKHNILKEKKW